MSEVETRKSPKTPSASTLRSYHGILGIHRPDWSLPICSYKTTKTARPGYANVDASEYSDDSRVLRQKVIAMADLIRQSERMIVYSGAGISTSAGICDYATKKAGVSNKLSFSGGNSPLYKRPTLAHRTLVALHRDGRLHQWVQQNHDGLPQKAGLPQSAINEIHGAWFDPSNPVVRMSGDLRDDLYSRLLKCEEETDLCISVGTSMSGMNADRVFETVSEKAAGGDESVLGGVIINKQKTQHDSIATLRIFADIDEVFRLLAEEMNLIGVLPDEEEPQWQSFDENNIVFSSYNKRGKLIKEDSTEPKAQLSLALGAKVRLCCGPYAGDTGEITMVNREGHYKISFRHKLKKSGKFRVFERTMGKWMIDAGLKGELECLPVVSA